MIKNTFKSPAAEEKLKLIGDLVPMLARAIGPLCEVVLHENTSSPPTIRAIGNGHVSGRTRGDLMTHVIVDGQDMTNGDKPLFNYMASTPDGRRVRVSLLPIRDHNEVIGYIAISFLTQELSVAMQALSALVEPEPHEQSINESFTSPKQVIGDAASEYVRRSGRPLALMERRERVALLGQLKEKGVFQMRGAIREVAHLFGISRTAVYNYLSELN